MVKTGELPGYKVQEALRAIAYQIAEARLPYHLSSEQLLEMVLSEGKTVDHWAHQMPKHEIIC